MFKRLLFAAALMLSPLTTVQAQQSPGAVVVNTCGSDSLGFGGFGTQQFRMDRTGNLCTNASASLVGSSSNSGAAIAPSGTNLATVAYNYGFDGTNWQYAAILGHALQVNVASGANPVEGTSADTSASNTMFGALLSIKASQGTQIPPGTNVIGGVYPPLGYAAIATNQVSVLTSATLVVAARTGTPGTGRGDVTITDEGSGSMWCGGSGVTNTTGSLISAGSARTFKTMAAVYCVAGSTQVVDYVESF